MTTVAVLGAGAGGAAAVAELSARGHKVRLWNRSAATLRPFQDAGGVAYTGVLGDGKAVPEAITADLGDALDGADVALVCLPTLVLGDVARALIDAGMPDIPIVLNPGHTGGALEFHAVFTAAGAKPPPIAEFSTLTYIARKYAPDEVTVTLAAHHIWAAAMPGGAPALAAAQDLYPAAEAADDVLATSLANVNLVLHPPGAVLGAAWVEATNGDFTFYVEGMTPGVARVMRALDEERLAVARTFGHEMPPLIAEMASIGTVEAGDADSDDYAGAIGAGRANAKIKAPDSFQHRYYREDFGHGLMPFLALAAAAGVEVPVAAALMRLGVALIGPELADRGRDAAAMGIAGLNRDGVCEYVRGKA
jgi:opine dehydrogenase